MAFPSLSIGDLTAKMPIVQGGMGVGISLSGLASSTATFTTDMAILATEKEKLRKAKEASRGEAD